MIRINWKVTIFSLVCLTTFVRLGFWQLDRAEWKVGLLEDTARLEAAPPVTFDELAEAGEPVNGTRVQLEGHYAPSDALLLDNRVMDGKVGFEVLVPFSVSGSSVDVLVNRGFVAMGRTRDELPPVPPIDPGVATLLARVYVPEEPLVASGQWIRQRAELPIVQVADAKAIGSAIGRSLYPYVLRLEASDVNALPRFWPVSVMQPEKHRGYALQWFLMAVAVVIAWGALTYRTQDEVEHDRND